MCTPWARARAWPARTRSPILSRFLRDPREHREEQIPGGRRGVDPGLLVALNPNTGRLELVHVPHHRADALATQAVERPDQQYVELPPVGGSEDGGERDAIASRAARGFGIDADDLEAEPI